MIRLFRHFVSLGMVLIALAEFALFTQVALFAAQHYYQGHPTYHAIGAVYRPWLFAAVLTFLHSIFGLYDWSWTRGPISLITRLGGSLLVSALLFGVGITLFPAPFLLNSGLLVALGMAGLFSALIRLLFMEFGKINLFRRRVLVLGTGTRAAVFEQIIAQGEDKGIEVVGYLPVGEAHRYVPQERILDESGSLYEIAQKYRIAEIVVAIRQRRGGGMPLADLLECKLRGLPTAEMADFCERQTGLLPLGSLNTSWIIFSDGFTPGSSRDTVKRLFDICISAAFLILFLPLILLTILLLKMESRGPVFYTQVRVGQFGHPFTILKFRSMYVDAEKNGLPVWARNNDDRITRVGRFIRRTRIDELPQIINVFLGHMSFVGPRPERPYFVDELSAQIPYYHARHSVKPGITGWAQVNFPYGASVEDAMRKLEYDLYYVKNHSLFLDILILVSTVQVVILGAGVR